MCYSISSKFSSRKQFVFSTHFTIDSSVVTICLQITAVVSVYFILCQPLPLCLQAALWHVGCPPCKEGSRSLGRCWEQSRGAVGDPVKQTRGAQQTADLAACQVSTETASCTDTVFPTKDQRALIQTQINTFYLGCSSLSRAQLWLRKAAEKTPGRGYTEVLFFTNVATPERDEAVQPYE